MEVIRVGLVQKYVPHYRVALFKKLTELSRYRWEFLYGKYPGTGASGVQIETHSIIPTKPVTNIWLGKAVWQKGLLKQIYIERYNAIVFELGLYILSNLPLLKVARLMHIPVIGWGKGIPGKGKQRSYLMQMYEKYIYRHCDAFLAYGNVAAEHFAMMGVPEDKIFIAQNSVDTKEIAENIPYFQKEAEKIRQKLDIRSSSKVFGYLGRLVQEKRVDQIIRAFIQVVNSGIDAVLLIVGDGPERKALQNIAQESGIGDKVFFMGKVSPGEENVYFQLFDVLLSFRESGLAVLQAMAHGKVVLVAPEKLPEVELVEDNVTGFVTMGFSLTDLVHGIFRVVDNAERWTTVGRNAQHKVLENATIEKMIATFDQAVEYTLRVQER